MRRHPGVALLGLALLVASCAALFSSSPRLGGGDRIRPGHEKHARAKVLCLKCHEPIYDAETLAGQFSPKEASCLECHRAEKAKGNCQKCHADVRFAQAFVAKTSHLRMSHAKHVDLVKEDCTRCHGSLPEGRRLPATTVAMDSCLGCHEHKKEYAAGRCEGCHDDLSRYALEPLSLFSHEGDFVREHATPARAAASTCAKCHDQSQCADCHARTAAVPIEVKFSDRVQDHFIHRNDYLGRHSLEARAEPATCRRCHGTTFCEDCHNSENLTPRAGDPRNPHPPGYSFPGPESHADDARRDIGACASCHDRGAQSVCVDCHRVGGIGGNPHPDAWQTRHKSEDVTRNGMCAICHAVR